MKKLLCLMFMVSLAGCNSLGLDKIGFSKAEKGTLLPGGAFKLSPRYAVAYMDIIMVAGLVGLMYQVVDPQAPAWEILETRLPDRRVIYSLRMQRVHNGGEGEARMVLQRRATELARESGMAGYEIISYTESMDSRLFLPHRLADAEVRMIAPPVAKL
ncbi:hypothetical protein [Viridibacterium curvum]|uniref:Lipoprotein n=1 Tax=Viridibacterium curvum TaxID=1101404 RepID=A0ABP9QAZ9_9RHOO